MESLVRLGHSQDFALFTQFYHLQFLQQSGEKQQEIRHHSALFMDSHAVVHFVIALYQVGETAPKLLTLLLPKYLAASTAESRSGKYCISQSERVSGKLRSTHSLSSTAVCISGQIV